MSQNGDAYYGDERLENELATMCGTTPVGTGRIALAEAAIELGFTAQLIEHVSLSDLERALKSSRPLIAVIDAGILYVGLHVFGHAVVIVGIEDETVVYHDPEGNSEMRATWSRFAAAWDTRDRRGVLIWKP